MNIVMRTRVADRTNQILHVEHMSKHNGVTDGTTQSLADIANAFRRRKSHQSEIRIHSNAYRRHESSQSEFRIHIIAYMRRRAVQ